MSPRIILALAGAAALGAAALAPTPASAFSHSHSPVVKGPTIQSNRHWNGFCGGANCHPDKAIFVRRGNPGNAVFAR